MPLWHDITFDLATCRQQVEELGDWLKARPLLKEQKDIRPFFEKRHQLSAFIGAHAPNVSLADRLSFEFSFQGDFRADIVVGNTERRAYCFVEFEDGSNESIFKHEGNRSVWTKRFEHVLSTASVSWWIGSLCSVGRRAAHGLGNDLATAKCSFMHF